MDFSELVDEVQARGFDYLSDTRAGRYVNTAYLELCGLHQWPFLEESAIGTAPLAISDLGTIEAVIDQDLNRELFPVEYRDLLAAYGDLSTTGVAEFYYIANPSGTLTVATYPVTTNTIGVQFWEVPAELTGTDTPVVPARYHDLIVDLAVCRAYRDSDNHSAAEALQAHVDRRVLQMVNQLFAQQVQGPDFQQVRGASEDW